MRDRHRRWVSDVGGCEGGVRDARQQEGQRVSWVAGGHEDGTAIELLPFCFGRVVFGERSFQQTRCGLAKTPEFSAVHVETVLAHGDEVVGLVDGPVHPAAAIHEGHGLTPACWCSHRIDLPQTRRRLEELQSAQNRTALTVMSLVA